MRQAASVGSTNDSRKDQRTRWRRIGLLAGSLVLLSLLIAAGTALLVRDLHRQAIVATQRDLGSLSAVLADQADRALQAIGLVQDGIIRDSTSNGIVDEAAFAAHFGTRQTHDLLRSQVATLPQVNAITIIDNKGKLLNYTRGWPIPDVDISDRDYFQALSGNDAPALFVSRPVRNRGDGAWTMYLARRISAPDGRFLGLVLGAVEMGYFERLYAAVAVSPDYSFSLFRSDGLLLVRQPRLPDAVGQTFSGSAGRIVSEGGASRGVIRVRSTVDGTDRLVSTVALPHFPIWFGIARTVEASLEDWRHQAILLTAAASVLILALVVIAWLGMRQLRDQRALLDAEAARAAAEERARGKELLRQEHVRFGVAMDNMTQGLWLFDQDWRLVLTNSRMTQILTRPNEAEHPLPIGSGIGCAIRRLSAARLLPPARARAAVAALRRDVAAGRNAQATWALGDGRTLVLRIRPVSVGGWLLTCDDRTEQRQAEARVNFLAHHDALTLLPNRALFGTALSAAIAEDTPFAVVYLDIDRFKAVNDHHGHAVGDLLLREVATRLQRCLPDRDTVARLGGDEFAIILAGPIDRATACARAATLVEEFSLPCILDEKLIIIGASIGITLAPADGRQADLLLRRAGIALGTAKRQGLGQIRVFDPDMERTTRDSRQMQAELSRALEHGEFELHYQPLIRLSTREIVGFEALIRWRHPERGLVPPNDFISVAEETGLIVPIGEWVLATACAEAAQWKDGLVVAVNLSPVQFRETRLVASVAAALASSGLRAECLELEITETMLLHETEENLRTLHRLRALGIAIALDDFGTGYSSLGYLRRFPFDKVKIDQSFVRDLVTAQESRAVIRAITYLCAELGMRTLAEGIETEAQRDLLAAERCHDGQGYLFSRPVPPSELPRLLAAARPLMVA